MTQNYPFFLQWPVGCFAFPLLSGIFIASANWAEGFLLVPVSLVFYLALPFSRSADNLTINGISTSIFYFLAFCSPLLVPVS